MKGKRHNSGMKTVLIVGSSHGIGYACAKKFLAEGYRVMALSRTECVLAGVKNYLCDVSDPEKLGETLDLVAQEAPSLDFFIYSAGFSMASPLEHVESADYRYLFEVDFFGFTECLRRLIAPLRHACGAACVISSLGSVALIPFDSYYTAAKAALNAFCLALQAELRPRGVRVFSVLPGGTRTDFTFKRKVYPPEKTGDYKSAQERAVGILAEIEQNGQSAEKAAKYVYEKFVQNGKSVLYVPGIKNKLIYFATKTLPQRLILFLTREKFFTSTFDRR